LSGATTHHRAPSPRAADIAAMLASQIASLAPQLLPGGRRCGPEWRVGGVDGSPGQSLAVHIGAGPKAGVWMDFSTGESGDALDLIAAVHCRGDAKAAYRWALHYLGMASGAAPATQRAYAAPKTAKAEPATDYRNAALALYLAAQPSLAGTPADLYLKARGIDLAILGRQPRALRFHPACTCREADARLPALIAAVTDAEGRHVATHRTWLAQHGGVWGKAKLAMPKMTLGTLHGATIRLWRGASGKNLAHAPIGEPLGIGEGIETCLSVAIACPELRVLCGVSMANIGSVLLPDHVGTVVIFGDNDGANDAARRGLARAVNHFAGTGRAVRVARSPRGKDFNDAIKRVGM
jgi:hypothetical protein